MSLRGWPAEREPFLQMHSFLPKCLTKKCKAKKESQLYTESFNARNAIAANCAKQLKIDTSKMMSMADLPPKFNSCYDEAAKKSPVNTYLAQQIACGQKMKCFKKSVLKQLNKMKKKGGRKKTVRIKKKNKNTIKLKKGGTFPRAPYEDIANSFGDFNYYQNQDQEEYYLPHQLIPGYEYRRISCEHSKNPISLHDENNKCVGTVRNDKEELTYWDKEEQDYSSYSFDNSILTFIGVFLQENYGNPELSNKESLEKTYKDPKTTYNVAKLFFKKPDKSYICYNSNKINRFVLYKKHIISTMFVAIIRGVVERGDRKTIVSNADDSLIEELESKDIYISPKNDSNTILVNYIFKTKIKCKKEDAVCAQWYNVANSNSTDEVNPPNKTYQNPHYGENDRKYWLYV